MSLLRGHLITPIDSPAPTPRTTRTVRPNARLTPCAEPIRRTPARYHAATSRRSVTASGAVAGTYPVQVDAPETITTERLLLRRPVAADAEGMQQSYAGDAEVTKLLGWPRHLSVDDTLAFIRWSDEAWSIGPVGPYVIANRQDVIIGSTGLDVETAHRAGRLRAGSGRLGPGVRHGSDTRWRTSRMSSALAGCTHCATPTIGPRHGSKKAGFSFEGVLRRHTVFPNLDPDAGRCSTSSAGRDWFNLIARRGNAARHEGVAPMPCVIAGRRVAVRRAPRFNRRRDPPRSGPTTHRSSRARDRPAFWGSSETGARRAIRTR